MTQQQISKIHSAIAHQTDEGWILGGNLVLALAGSKQQVSTRKEAESVLRHLLQSLLENEDYLSAAGLLWSEDMFDTRPESVQRIFKALGEDCRVLLQGASSMSKTYAAGAWMYLDYRRDPAYTSIKLGAVNEDHLRKNLFAHVVALHRNAAIKMENEDDIIIRDSDLYLGLKSKGMDFGISGVAFKQSQEASGQFKGYKPKPYRMLPHPKFGMMSRLRVLGDEGQNWPDGPFKDFNSLVASMTGTDIIKLVIAFNPEDAGQTAVQMAEHPEGWSEDQLDTLYDWKGKSGWRVCRLDAARCENVIQKSLIYPGLQSYEGYLSYLKAGGDSSPSYFTFARGFPPMKGAVNTIIPTFWPTQQRGEALFVGPVTACASVDLAYQGADTPQMVVGRWGMATGWYQPNGKFIPFMDRKSPDQKKSRHVLQIDQIIPLLRGHDTVSMAEEIMGKCKLMHIKPEWVVIDKTGNGFGTWSHLKKYWGDVFGVMWAEGATEMKVLSEDPEPAKNYYDGISSEMWFTLKRWLDPVVCAVIFNPIIPTSPLNTQLISRRFRFVKGGKMKVERKDEYKARNQHSPDEADALIMLPQLIRARGDALPGTVEHVTYDKVASGEKMMERFDSADEDDTLERQVKTDTPAFLDLE